MSRLIGSRAASTRGSDDNTFANSYAHYSLSTANHSESVSNLGSSPDSANVLRL